LRKEPSCMMESVVFPGYFHSPDYDSIVVSREGRVIDQRNLFCPVPVMGKAWPYLLINIWGHGTVTLHRLIARTFLECPADPDDYVVNHIDGDKSNCHVSNLEWVTPSGNATHAYVTGLRSDNRSVLTRDLETGEVKYYYSLNQAAREFNVNQSAVWRYLNSDSLVPWKLRYDMIYEGQCWRPLTEADIGKVVNGQPKDVVVVDSDGSVMVLSSAADTARFFGIPANVLYYTLATSGKLDNGAMVCYMDEFSGDLEIARRIESTRPKVDRPNFRRKPVPVVVTDLSTGLKVQWDSVQDFAHSMGTSKNTVQKSMLVKDGRWAGYHLKYLK